MCRWAGPPRRADGTEEIGLDVLATTLSIVAVFLPIGFMGGIVGKFFHEFGITIVAAVLISMFVSFTLDPMLSRSGTTRHRTPTARRAGDAVRQDHRPRHRLVRPRHRPGWATCTSSCCAGRCATSSQRWRWRSAIFGSQRGSWCPAGHRVRAQGRLLRNHAQLLHPVGSSLGSPRPRRARWTPILREMPEVRYTWPPSTPAAPRARCTPAVYMRLVDRKDRTSAASTTCPPCCARALARPGITVTHRVARPRGRAKSRSCSRSRARRPGELERLTQPGHRKIGAVPAWSTWIPASNPTSRRGLGVGATPRTWACRWA